MIKHLYDIFHEKWTNTNGSIYLYSDPHFSELESYRFRHLVKVPDKMDYLNKFKDGDTFTTYETFVKTELAKADMEQVKQINSVCGKNDTLIILGDIGNIEIVKKLKARYKILILGNHDKGASNYKRKAVFEKVEVDNYLDGKTPNELCMELSKEDQDKYYAAARKKAEAEYKQKPDFIKLGDSIYYDFKEPFMYWVAYFDNKLFDEVYEGPLMINDRIILSHEPIQVPDYLFNIHGHVHKKDYTGDTKHLNICAEAVNYKPVNLASLIKKGLLKETPDIHRPTIDSATERKKKKAHN